MSDILHIQSTDSLPCKHKAEHAGYEYYRRDIVPRGTGNHCMLSLYEIPPLQAAYPYHYHVKNEEIFYILSGQGILKTPEGERMVAAGDYLFFPAEQTGAHKLTNTSETELLVYLDFDAIHSLDVTFFPDTGKMGVWGKDINRVYQVEDAVEYYHKE